MKIEKLRNVECPLCRSINKVGKYQDESYAFVLFCYMGHLPFILNRYEEMLSAPSESMMNRCIPAPTGLIGCGATKVPHPTAAVKGFLMGL